MDLLQNPFYLLTTTQQDNRNRIIELAEERSLLSDVDKCMAARATLTNPRKRISAEVAWLPGVAPERIYDMLLLLESSVGNHFGCDKTTPIAPIDSLASVLASLPYAKKYNVADEVLELLKTPDRRFTEVAKFLNIDKLKPVAQANLLAARISRLPDCTPNIVAKWVIAIAQVFEGVNSQDVLTTLNQERKTSGFPEITDLSVIETEIRNRRLYYQQVIKSALENILTAKARVKAVTIILLEVESTPESDESGWPILVEDAVDAYEEGAATFLETIKKNIEIQNKKIRIAADAETPDVDFTSMVDELLQTIKDWDVIAQPIQLNKNRQGLHHEASHDVADRVRQLAIHLFNEYDKLGFSQKILNVLKEASREIPAITERITADLDILNKIAKGREQQIF